MNVVELPFFLSVCYTPRTNEAKRADIIILLERDVKIVDFQRYGYRDAVFQDAWKH